MKDPQRSDSPADLRPHKNSDTDTINLDDIFYPGPLDIAGILQKSHKYWTVVNHDDDREKIFQYEEGIGVRCEDWLKAAAHQEFLKQFIDNEEKASIALEKLNEEDEPDKQTLDRLQKVIARCQKGLHEGPSTHEINEVLNIIRRETFIDSTLMNPKTHIPFRNGLLNIRTWKLEPFSSDHFFTWRAEANYLEDLATRISLNNCPLYKQYLLDTFYPLDIPQILEYNGYCLYPAFPTAKTDFRIGKEGIGKGVEARILEALLGTGYGTVDLNKLLTSDRFQFSGIRERNLLCDAEINTKFRRGTVRSWRNFNNLFGTDTIYNEQKFKEGENEHPFSKGLFLGNLPLFPNDNLAAFRRMLLKQTKPGRSNSDIKDIHKLILEKERDQIATLFVKYLRILERNDWIFFNELTIDSTASMWQQFADPVGNFMDEAVTYSEGSETKVDDGYEIFSKWCFSKGIPKVPRQTFASRIGKSYPKRKAGQRNDRYPVFTNCKIEEVIPVGKQEKLDTGQNEQGSPIEGFSRYTRYGVPLEYIYLPCEKKRIGLIENHVSKDHVPKLDTLLSEPKTAENKPPKKDKGVSNFKINQELYDWFIEKVEGMSEVDLSNISFPEEFEYVDWNEKISVFTQVGIDSGFRVEEGGTILRRSAL